MLPSFIEVTLIWAETEPEKQTNGMNSSPQELS